MLLFESNLDRLEYSIITFNLLLDCSSVVSDLSAALAQVVQSTSMEQWCSSFSVTLSSKQEAEEQILVAMKGKSTMETR